MTLAAGLSGLNARQGTWTQPSGGAGCHTQKECSRRRAGQMSRAVAAACQPPCCRAEDQSSGASQVCAAAGERIAA